jgi:ubiquinone/menaquinone biosynthesis C-methylase UbiE
VEYVAQKPNAQFLEIGCGTGAGADLISRIVHPTVRYTALDMQKAAIETCIKLHAAHDNPHLTCVHGNGKTLPVADNSVDIVVVSETHIAEMEIGPEEKAIFAEMKRVLVPGGLFVWGNALPTKVWGDGAEYLQANGFSACGAKNVTGRAIVARDEDNDRVELFMDQLLGMYSVFKLPIVGAPCRHTLDIMIKNFYRHPGTDLYQRMVVGADSYMNLCHKFEGK